MARRFCAGDADVKRLTEEALRQFSARFDHNHASAAEQRQVSRMLFSLLHTLVTTGGTAGSR